MAMNLLKIPPKGIDKPIQDHQGALYGLLKNNLYSDVLTEDHYYECYGRSYTLEDKTGTYPTVYGITDEYREVLLDDTRLLLSFYDISDKVTHHGGGVCSTDVHLVFFAKAGSLETQQHRPDEEVRRKVIMAIRRISRGGFKLKEEIKGREALSLYTSDRVKNLITADMQPWHVFRFDFTVEYYPEET